jgi:hypothetical protein
MSVSVCAHAQPRTHTHTHMKAAGEGAPRHRAPLSGLRARRRTESAHRRALSQTLPEFSSQCSQHRLRVLSETSLRGEFSSQRSQCSQRSQRSQGSQGSQCSQRSQCVPLSVLMARTDALALSALSVLSALSALSAYPSLAQCIPLCLRTESASAGEGAPRHRVLRTVGEED